MGRAFHRAPAGDLAKLWADHYASVADYWAHKARDPGTPAGAMVVLHSWAPVVIGISSVLTCNPVVAIPALAVARQRDPDSYSAKTS